MGINKITSLETSANRKSGFTIVELSLASAFLGILLMSIALLANHVISIYQKGLSLKAVNSVGEDLIDEFSRAIAASRSNDLSAQCNRLSSMRESCIDGSGGYKFMYQQNYGSFKIIKSGTTINGAASSGVFCTGQYSYIWNTGYALGDGVYEDSGSVQRATLSIKSGAHKKDYTSDEIRLIRVDDVDRAICASGIRNGYQNQTAAYEIDSVSSAPISLLDKSEDDLVLYDFTMFAPTYHSTTGHAFYAGTFILGTQRGGVNITSAGNFCEEQPGELSTDFAYCAMNKFNFAMRATGESIK